MRGGGGVWYGVETQYTNRINLKMSSRLSSKLSSMSSKNVLYLSSKKNLEDKFRGHRGQ